MIDKRIVLVEDRVERQKKFALEYAIDLNVQPYLKNICGGQEFDDFKQLISEKKAFDSFDVIMIHRSALTTNERQILVEKLNENEKILVFFSGGISSISLQEFKKGKLLTINVKDFYNGHLVNVVNELPFNVYRLAFGNYWQINMEAVFLENLSYYIESFTDPVPLPIVLSKLNILPSLRDIYFKDFINQKVCKTDLEYIKHNLINSINYKLK